MNSFTIKDLENLSGIRAHTIRIWEQRYSFLKPQRTETNIRYYSNEELKAVLNIALLNKYGFKISRISRMTDQELKDRILSLSQQEALQERIVNELIHCMVDLNMEKLEAIIDNHVLSKGIEKTITTIIFPFLERIGILWLTNHINPAQEHLISNVIRQKLIVGIEYAKSYVRHPKKVLLFLPEGEHHELGLLFTHYLLKSRGISTIYIGANIPLNDVIAVAELKQPDYLYSHLTTVSNNFNFEKFLVQVSQALPDIHFIISGQLTTHYKKKIPSSIYFKRSLPEVMEYIDSL